jgi:hypothetical protein
MMDYSVKNLFLAFVGVLFFLMTPRSLDAVAQTAEESQLIAKILSHLERAAPEQYQSELPLGARGPPVQSRLLCTGRSE